MLKVLRIYPGSWFLTRCHRPWICRVNLWTRVFPSLHLLLDGLQHIDKETRCKELRDLPKRTELILGPRVAPCLLSVYPDKLSPSHHSVLSSLILMPFSPRPQTLLSFSLLLLFLFFSAFYFQGPYALIRPSFYIQDLRYCRRIWLLPPNIHSSLLLCNWT